eukprot:15450125-Alexandrium_andersonii.AAC.1
MEEAPHEADQVGLVLRRVECLSLASIGAGYLALQHPRPPVDDRHRLLGPVLDVGRGEAADIAPAKQALRGVAPGNEHEVVPLQRLLGVPVEAAVDQVPPHALLELANHR